MNAYAPFLWMACVMITALLFIPFIELVARRRVGR